jgi:hypothetical protein
VTVTDGKPERVAVARERRDAAQLRVERAVKQAPERRGGESPRSAPSRKGRNAWR